MKIQVCNGLDRSRGAGVCLIPIQDNISLHGISLKLKMLYINLSIANPDTLHELLKMSETISYKRYM